jgi:6,7-dimethyl-8-ribityllumazine synthase
MSNFEGDFRVPTGRFAIVASRFNGFVVEHLLTGTLDGWRRHGISDDAVDIVHVPGALEIPVIAKQLAASGRYAAIVCLGAVIRGQTAHFDIVANESARGVAQVALETGIPVINAILTTDTLEQAIDRAGAKLGNKGFEAALAAIEMANLTDQLRSTNTSKTQTKF